MTCLNPIPAFDLGVNPATGKRLIRFRSSVSETPDYFLPCGKCEACLETRRNEWVRRCKLELLQCPQSSFVTLTFSDDYCPPSVSKRDLQLFFKRLRNVGRDIGIDASHLRYFACGEYGKRHHRPHYHAIIFGVDMLGDSRWQPYPVSVKGSYVIWSSRVLERYWPFGFVSVDEVTPNNIKYVAKYITKRDGLFMCSQGIGRGLFVQATRSGRVSSMRPNPLLRSVGSHDSLSVELGKAPTSLPRFVLRYLERFYPDLLAHVKLKRAEYCASRRDDFTPPSVRVESLRSKLRSEEKLRILDETS